jgi:CMP/dCMP kinase
MLKNKIIAIDGPAASGKSTVAKIIAGKLGYLYIDSGAMFRVVAFLWLEYLNSHSVNVDKTNNNFNEKILKGILDNLEIDLQDNSNKVLVGSRDLSNVIRTNIISQHVSYIASFGQVRSKLLILQRNLAKKNNVIMDGRDIGTVVFPDASTKIFLTASPEIRAKRRFQELSARGETVNLDELIEEIKERDKLDSTRDIAPLKKADTAYEINTDNLSIEQVADKIIDLARNPLGNGV